jgi:hypothetical protein
LVRDLDIASSFVCPGLLPPTLDSRSVERRTLDSSVWRLGTGFPTEKSTGVGIDLAGPDDDTGGDCCAFAAFRPNLIGGIVERCPSIVPL